MRTVLALTAALMCALIFGLIAKSEAKLPPENEVVCEAYASDMAWLVEVRNAGVKVDDAVGTVKGLIEDHQIKYIESDADERYFLNGLTSIWELPPAVTRDDIKTAIEKACQARQDAKPLAPGATGPQHAT